MKIFSVYRFLNHPTREVASSDGDGLRDGSNSLSSLNTSGRFNLHELIPPKSVIPACFKRESSESRFRPPIKTRGLMTISIVRMMNDMCRPLRDSTMQHERKLIDDFCDLLPSAKFFSGYFANAIIVRRSRTTLTKISGSKASVSSVPRFTERRNATTTAPRGECYEYLNTHKPTDRTLAVIDRIESES